VREACFLPTQVLPADNDLDSSPPRRSNLSRRSSRRFVRACHPATRAAESRGHDGKGPVADHPFAPFALGLARRSRPSVGNAAAIPQRGASFGGHAQSQAEPGYTGSLTGRAFFLRIDLRACRRPLPLLPHHRALLEGRSSRPCPGPGPQRSRILNVRRLSTLAAECYPPLLVHHAGVPEHASPKPSARQGRPLDR
jgi:hypothetical protein